MKWRLDLVSVFMLKENLKKKNILGQKFIVEGKMNPVGLYAMKGSKNQYNKEYYPETTLKF